MANGAKGKQAANGPIKPGPKGKSKKPMTLHDLPSEDEDDADYVLEDVKPGQADEGGESSSDEEEEEEDRPPAKKIKAADGTAVPSHPAPTTTNAAAIDDLWASFNEGEASASSSTPVASTTTVAAPVPRKITITREYRFAGKPVSQEVEVDADSEEAQAWLARPRPLPTDSLTHPSDTSVSTAATAQTSKPPPPGPRKKKGGGLAAMAAGLGKPKKLTTLEKSKMDWNAHLSTEDPSVAAELARNRKDGYLEKKDFLQRAEDAKEQRLDQLSGKLR